MPLFIGYHKVRTGVNDIDEAALARTMNHGREKGRTMKALPCDDEMDGVGKLSQDVS